MVGEEETEGGVGYCYEFRECRFVFDRERRHKRVITGRVERKNIYLKKYEKNVGV